MDLGTLVGEVDEFEVVGGDEADAVLADEGADKGTASYKALAVVGAPEYLINEEEEGQGVRRFEVGEKGFEALDLGVEVGETLGYGVADADAGGEAEGHGMEGVGDDGAARVCQNEVDGDGAEEAALPGHVGAGEYAYLAQRVQSEVVADPRVVGEEGMTELRGAEGRERGILARHDLREGVGGVEVGEGCQGAQGLKLEPAVQPDDEVRREHFFVLAEPVGAVEVPGEDEVQGEAEVGVLTEADEGQQALGAAEVVRDLLPAFKEGGAEGAQVGRVAVVVALKDARDGAELLETVLQVKSLVEGVARSSGSNEQEGGVEEEREEPERWQKALAVENEKNQGNQGNTAQEERGGEQGGCRGGGEPLLEAAGTPLGVRADSHAGLDVEAVTEGGEAGQLADKGLPLVGSCHVGDGGGEPGAQALAALGSHGGVQQPIEGVSANQIKVEFERVFRLGRAAVGNGVPIEVHAGEMVSLHVAPRLVPKDGALDAAVNRDEVGKGDEPGNEDEPEEPVAHEKVCEDAEGQCGDEGEEPRPAVEVAGTAQVREAAVQTADLIFQGAASVGLRYARQVSSLLQGLHGWASARHERQR